jgi:hypothetical protein
MIANLGPTTEAQLSNPEFTRDLWKLSPVSMGVRLSNGQYHARNYIQLLSRKLVDVAMGRCPRLIICLPPRMGKSELVSHWFATWYLTNFQSRKIILASYELDFVSRWGAKVRDTLLENEDLLGAKFRDKNPARHFFELIGGGSMTCAGVGGALTGRGAHVLIVDDFVKNSEEANSLTMREKTFAWWTSTARTRLEPFIDPVTRKKFSPAVIVIATRWHTDDLIGRLIDPTFYSAKGERDSWEVFVFPAAADPRAEQYYRLFGLKVNDLRMGALGGDAHKANQQSVRERLAELDNPEWRDILGRKFGEPLCPEIFNAQDLALSRGASIRDWYSMMQQIPGDESDDGNVYSQFDERLNCKTLVRDDSMQLFVSWDFNVAPMTVVVGQYSRGNGIREMERCEVLKEIILDNSNTPQMAERLLAELEEYSWGYVLEVEIFGDAAGTQRSSNSTKSNWQIVADYFQLNRNIHPRYRRRKANPLVKDRVNAVNSMLKAADGVRRLYIDDVKCPELVRDFKKVKWQTDPGGNSTGVLDKSDKKRTHVSDALGYCVELLFSLMSRGGGRKGVLQ